MEAGYERNGKADRLFGNSVGEISRATASGHIAESSLGSVERLVDEAARQMVCALCIDINATPESEQTSPQFPTRLNTADSVN